MRVLRIRTRLQFCIAPCVTGLSNYSPDLKAIRSSNLCTHADMPVPIIVVALLAVPHRQGVVCSASPSPNADGEDSNDNTQADDLDDDSSDSEAGSDDEPDSEPGAARNPLTSRLITQEVLLFCFQQVHPLHNCPFDL